MNFEEEIEKLKETNRKLLDQIEILSQCVQNFVGRNTSLGEAAHIQSPSNIYSDDQNPVVIGDGTRVFRGADWLGPVAVGKHVFINKDSYIRSQTIIGDYVRLGASVQLITDTHEMRSWRSRAGERVVKPIVIGEGSWIGPQAVVLPGVTIGRGAVVVAGSVVMEDVPDNAMVAGNPATVIQLLEPLNGEPNGSNFADGEFTVVETEAEEHTTDNDVQDVEFTILTMSRGDESRLEDWVLYHHRLGFNRFIILLDNPCDNSESLLKKLKEEHRIRIEVVVYPANGEYYSGLTSSEHWKKVVRWRKIHAEEIASSGLPIGDPLSKRQYEYFSDFLEKLANSQKIGWVSLIDVDEYINLVQYQSIRDFVAAYDKPRIRFTSYNFDMTGWDGVENVRSFATKRWDISELSSLNNKWSQRVKSIVKYDAAVPLVSVHRIAEGAFDVVDSAVARLHHYKSIHQEIGIGYSSFDSSIAD